jgi:plastocyanin
MRKRMLTLVAALLAATLIVAGAACGDDDDDDLPPNGPPPNGNDVIQVTAENNQFDTGTITVGAGETVVIDLTTHDIEPHNMAFYESPDTADKFFTGDFVVGDGETVTYQFQAPEEPGNYYFQCDVHPHMNGDFIVE